VSEADEAALVEINAVRRRQLVNAVTHGTTRSWTSVRRRTPALILGLVLAVVVLLGVAVTQVVRAQLAANHRTMNGQTPSPTSSTPAPTATR
jgi:hypothetical protein